MDKERINWIDQAKGIGIFLVVIGHMNIPLKLSVFIFSFHMPLFFFISGYLYNENKYSKDLKSIIISKATTLIWPFITFTIFACLLLILTKENDLLKSFNFVEFLKGNRSPNTPLWFLTALFTTELLFSQIIRFFKHKFLLIFIFILVVAGFINASTLKIEGLLNIHIALIALLFFSGGWFFKKYGWINKFGGSNKQLLQIAISLILLLVVSLNNSKIDMLENNYGNIALMILAAFLGIIFTVLLAKQFLRFKLVKTIVDYLGKNSLTILGIHIIIAPFVVSVFGKMPFRIDRVITIILIFFFIEVINRYFPQMLRLNILKKIK